jgi:arginine exporter protein ArgO
MNIVLLSLSSQHQNTFIVFLHFYVSDIILHCVCTQAIELFISKMQQRRQEIVDICMLYLALCFLSVKPRREEQRHRCTVAALISHQGAQLSIKVVSLNFVLVDFRGMYGRLLGGLHRLRGYLATL